MGPFTGFVERGVHVRTHTHTHTHVDAYGCGGLGFSVVG